MIEGQVTTKDLDGIIELLTQESQRETFENYPLIKTILDNLSIPIPTRLVPRGTTLARCRLNESKQFFDKIECLSYIHDPSKIYTLGRANEKNQSTFYCSDTHGVAIAETSEILRDQVSKEFELITTGAWIVEVDMIVVNIISNPSIKGVNSVVDAMSREFDEFVDGVKNENSLNVKKFLTFLSTEFTRHVKGDINKYKLTCAFANYIYDNLGLVDGIMYPSTIYPVAGLNFALRPTSVDTKMKFLGARRSRMDKVVGTTQYEEEETITAKSFNLITGQIEW